MQGAKYAGGLIGSNEVNNAAALIDSCYATGSVSATTDYAGGIIGYTTKAATISNCVAKNDAVTSAASNVGRIAGDNATASWGGATTLKSNAAFDNLALTAAGKTVTLTDEEKGETTKQGVDYSALLTAAALKEGSTLKPAFSGDWAPITSDDRTYVQGEDGSRMTLEIAQDGWLIFDWKVTDGKWSDDGLTFTAECGGTTLASWNIKGNSSSSKSWTTKCVNIQGTSEQGPKARAMWSFGADSSSVQHIGNVRLVTEAPTFAATATEGGTATVNDAASAAVEPGTSATFKATASDGYLFAGWKTSAEATDFVSKSISYTVAAYDEPINLVAVFEAPFEGEGTSANPFQLSTKDDLEKLASLYGANSFENVHFAIMDDIDATGFTGIASDSTTKYFQGSIKGNSHTISGLSTPLFDRLGDMSSVSDLKLSGDIQASKQYAGILAGFCKGALRDIAVSGSVASSEEYVGGLAGYADNNVINCTSSATVTCTYKYNTTTYGHVGGLIGQFGTYTSPCITGCAASGNVSGPGRVGGLVGDLYSTGAIKNSIATGNVTATGNYVGGLVGEYSTEGTIEGCTATGNVTGKTSVGGLVGYNDKQLKGGGVQITNSIASGDVKATSDNAGGLVGYTCREGSITNCQARNHTVESAGANVGRVIGNNTPSSWNGTKVFSGNLANNQMRLVANGAEVTLAEADKGDTTIHGADAKLKRIGDINNSGKMNIVDAQIAYDFSKGLYVEEALENLLACWSEGTTVDTLERVADVNGDGNVEAADAFSIQYAIHNNIEFGETM